MKFSNVINCLIFLGTVVGCSSDETLDREEVKVQAVRQEYNLSYSTSDSRITSKVFFRTSSSGDYIKLSSADSIEFNFTALESTNFNQMYSTREQIHFGSRRVPLYEYTQRHRLSSGSQIAWKWFDSESGESYRTETRLNFPQISLENSIEVVDTTLGEGVLVVIDKPLLSNQTLSLSFKGDNTRWATFNFQDETSSRRKFFIDGMDLNRRLQPKSTDDNDDQVIISGRQHIYMSSKVSSRENLDNGSPKGGTLKKTISYPNIGFEIIL